MEQEPFARHPELGDGPYVPDLVARNDFEAVRRARLGARVGCGSRPALLVVDATRGFVEERFPNGCKQGEAAADAIATLLEAFRSKSLPVLFTRGEPVNAVLAGRWRDKKFRADDAVDLMNTPEAHKVVDCLEPRPDEVVITKHKPSAFFGTDLTSILVLQGVDTLVVTGLTTSGCVRATVVDAFSYNYRVLVPIECVADRSQISHELSLFDMDSKYGDVVSLESLLAILRDKGKPEFL